jgi:hypothetical protein
MIDRGILFSEAVEQFDWQGRSLLDLPADSAAARSVADIMRKAGYGAP